MTAERWQRVKEVLDAALVMDRKRREEFLEEACSTDSELRREVDSLIASYEGSGDFLEAFAVTENLGVNLPRPRRTPVGSMLGPYRIVDEIGSGGMGTVYRAVRDDDTYRREVAIKVVRRGMDSDFILRRFRHERQILATLEHPNIASLLDAGSTDDGAPYFVMDFIKGQPVDEYCDTHKLTAKARLKLFRTVCLAVHHAHEHRIIHRDIKPGNILINEERVPKLLDFGIAKILDPELSTQAQDPTATLMRLMTPEYASPEQIRGETVTAASDVYSLGVLLYEVLTGHRPYRLRGRSIADLARIICDEEPRRPSTVIQQEDRVVRRSGTVTLTPEMISAARQTRPEQLRRTLSGDLDNIIMMAMRKEPNRRYPSAEALAEDIRRHLEGLPVSARKDTFWYRSGKFLYRNRTVMASTSAALLTAAVATFAFLRTPIGETASGTPAAPQFRVSPFTTLPGDEMQPWFSPDGSRIAFVWGGEDNSNLDIYVKAAEGGPLTRITTNEADDVSPTWSPDGKKIAFLRASRKETAIFLAPLDGGVHGLLASVFPARIDTVGRQLDWSKDGKFLAVTDKDKEEEPFRIVRVRARDGAKTPVTSPPDNYIGDCSPTISPDGSTIAFLRIRSSGVRDVHTVPVNGGEVRRITMDNTSILSVVWTPDGRDIVFSSNRSGGSHRLWSVPATGGTAVRLASVGSSTSDATYSNDGRRIAYTQVFSDPNIWRVDLANPTTVSGKPRAVVMSTHYDSSPHISPDGGQITFRADRSGYPEVWVIDNDGRNARQATNFRGALAGTPRWSPDGKLIAFDYRPEGQPEIYVVPAAGGEPKRITNHPGEDVVPSWSTDGKWIYFGSNRSGAFQVWKMPAEGGEPRQVTQGGGFAALESPDGKYVYYAKGRTLVGLWRIPVDGQKEELVLPDLKEGYWGNWVIMRDGIYFIDSESNNAAGVIRYFDLKTHRIKTVLELDRPPMSRSPALAAPPDGAYLLFSQIDSSSSHIMLGDLTLEER